MFEIVWLEDKVIVIAAEWVILLSVRLKKREWEVESRNVRAVRGCKEGTEILLKKDERKVRVGHYFYFRREASLLMKIIRIKLSC